MTHGTTNPPRVLLIAHNHPSLHPGGTEIFAHDLFTTLKDGGVPAFFLACTNQVHRSRKPGTSFQSLGRSADEAILWTGHFDRFYQSQIDLHGIVPDLADFLAGLAPDVVHIHHTLLLGVEMLFLIRRVLPRAAIVYTLHDYYPICAHEGQMVTPGDFRLCERAAPDACHRCFPDIGPDRFLMREKHLKTLFGLVDRFLAPSRFLMERYIAWGLPPAKIELMPQGRPATAPVPPRPLRPGEPRSVMGYFGNLSPFKGIQVALDGLARLAASSPSPSEAPLPTLHIHGGTPFQSDAFKARIAESIAASAGRAIPHGPYQRDELPHLMAGIDWVVVPSLWWENAPLVIQEAFQHGRPVICSGIGGMAEAVRPEVDGLHFRPGDAADLARTLARAAGEPGLWERLAANVQPVPTMLETARRHRTLYDALRPVPLLLSSAQACAE